MDLSMVMVLSDMGIFTNLVSWPNSGFGDHADAAAGGHDLAHGFAAFGLDAAGDPDALAPGFLFQLGAGFRSGLAQHQRMAHQFLECR